MKKIIQLTLFLASITLTGQETANLADFQLSNVTSPAFLLVDETPTSVYTPQNLRALMIHSLQNIGENLSIEITPFLLNKKQGRTYYNYMGIEVDSTDKDNYKLMQNPFSGVWTSLTVSTAYVDKEFESLEGKNKTFSLGARTTLFRLFDKEKVYTTAVERAVGLSGISVPRNIRVKGPKAIAEYLKDEFKKLDQEFTKTIKPIFQVDGAFGYGVLFRDNTISATLERFGTWLTANLSLPILNKDGKTKKNNYLNLFAITRYVEDGFSLNTNGTDNTLYYRDFGGKIELEVGRFALGYEYIRRNGSVDNYKSLGNIKYIINKEISLTGGFGKDFTDTNNLITLLGINWGLNLGSNKLKF